MGRAYLPRHTPSPPLVTPPPCSPGKQPHWAQQLLYTGPLSHRPEALPRPDLCGFSPPLCLQRPAPPGPDRGRWKETGRQKGGAVPSSCALTLLLAGPWDHLRKAGN